MAKLRPLLAVVPVPYCQDRLHQHLADLVSWRVLDALIPSDSESRNTKPLLRPQMATRFSGLSRSVMRALIIVNEPEIPESQLTGT